jgi:bacteriocin-like protein
VTIKLTSDQQKLLADKTGKNISELNIDLAGKGNLSDKDLEQVSGGQGYFRIWIKDTLISGD